MKKLTQLMKHILMLSISWSCSEQDALKNRSGAQDTASTTCLLAEDSPKYEWKKVSDTPGVSWYRMKFVTPKIGIAIGGADWNSEATPKPRTMMAKTADGGQTWNVSEMKGFPSGWVRGLDCLDEKTCIAVGEITIGMTTNGGETWEKKNFQDWKGFLWSAAFTKKGDTALVGTTGFADEPNRRANFLRSSNNQTFSGIGVGGEFVIYDQNCPKPGICFAAAYMSNYQTIDDGLTWKRISPSKFLPRYFGIDCLDEKQCWQVGAYKGDGPSIDDIIVSTSDGGASWVGNKISGNLDATNRLRFWRVDMIDSNIGFAVGCSSAPDHVTEVCQGSGMILQTTNGKDWTEIESPTKADIMDIQTDSVNQLTILDFSGSIWQRTLVSKPISPAAPGTEPAPPKTGTCP